MYNIRHFRYNINFKVLKILLFTGVVSFSQASWAKDVVQIGMLIDGHNHQQQKLVNKLSKELSVLLGSKYKISIPKNKILISNWSADKSISNYNQLIKDRSIDIIIAAGIVSSVAVWQQKRYMKPVIAVGIVDKQQLNLSKKNTSGIHNLTYILFNRSMINDLDVFYRVIPYRRVAIVANKDLLSLVLNNKKGNAKNSLERLMKKNKTEFISIPVDQSISQVIDNLEGVDAVYISYMGQLEGAEKLKLIKYLSSRKIPSFGASVTDVERGVLAAIAPKQPFNKIVRRLALNIEAILSGKNPAVLPVNISFEKKLTINMETAQKINFSPTFDVLSEAELINGFVDTAGRKLTLQQAINAALNANLSLAIQADNVKGSELNVDLARSNNYPSLSFSTTGTQIDEDRAETSFGKQAELTTTGTLKLQQLIYSEGQSGNVEIQEHLLTASQYNLEQQKLDVILDTSTAFFSVLKAKTGRNIQQENVKVTRQNLNIAKQREVAGFSGRADVYYWESQLATANTNYLSAINKYRLSQIQLNQLLNHRLDEKFTPHDISLTQGIYSKYLKNTVQIYVDRPSALAKFTSFLVTEAMSNSPEVLQINSSIDAQKRRLTSSKKKQILPDVSLVAEAQHVFSRNGAGANVAGVTPDDNTWSASVNLSWPLYEGGSIGIDAKQALNEIMNLKDQRLQLQQSLELKVRSALLDMVTQSVNLKSSRRSANFAGKSLGLVQDAYSRGKASVAELSEAQQTAIVADQTALNSVYDFFSTVLKTERAVGKFSLLSKPEEQTRYLNRLEDYFNHPTRSGVN